MEVYLTLADGKVFSGKSLTEKTDAVGILTFNTTEFAFEECITNPANQGKIMMFTFPLVGAMGINYEDNQSNIITTEAVICKTNSEIYSNFRAKTSIKSYLNDNKKVYAENFDTRAILVYLKNKGEMPAVISSKPLSSKEVMDRFNKLNLDYKPINYPLNENKSVKAKIIDLGGSKTFYKFLNEVGIYNSEEDYDIIVISNSNYKDIYNEDILNFINNNKDKKIIAFGDSNVILAKAFGLDYKTVDLGHKGTNIPVKNIISGKNHITGQNHIYYITEQEKINILYKNIHDNTTEAYISNDKSFAGFFFKPAKETFTKILESMRVK